MDGIWRVLKFIARSSRRLAVLIAGLAVVGAGLVMLVAPGPGVLVIIAGLAILATEFAWAEYLLDKAKDSAARAARKARDKASRRGPRRRTGPKDPETPVLAIADERRDPRSRRTDLAS